MSDVKNEGVNAIKKIVLGGFLFLGGAILFSVGQFGLADINVQANYMQLPRYLGIVAMGVGVVLGVLGLKEDS